MLVLGADGGPAPGFTAAHASPEPLPCSGAQRASLSASSMFKAAVSLRRVSQSRCHGTPRPCWLSSGVSGGKATVVRGVWGNYLNKGNHCPLQESQGPAADPGFIETGRSFFSGMSRRVLEWPFTLLAGHFSQFGTLAFLIS